VGISNDTFVVDGGTAVLACLGFGELDAEIMWTFNGAPVVNNSLTAIYEEDIIRGGSVFMLSYIEICGVTRPSLGAYTCTISNIERSHAATVQLMRLFNSKGVTHTVGGPEIPTVRV
jgi:hypothetical protein